MKHFLLFVTVFYTFLSISSAQYKNDNVAFKTVYLEELCKTLQNNPGYLLLDVRSKGEHHDTSTAQNLNIGRLKNATNIDIRELPARLPELTAYRDKPIFVYCSHSQRSRRVSKMLADSGYTKVFNINGGLTSLHLFKNDLGVCPELSVETNVNYKLVSSQQLADEIQNKKSYFILDVRKDSIFNGKSLTQRENAQGRFESAVNIPLAELSNALQKIPTNASILIVDEFGNESPKAAQLLAEKGYKDVSVLFNGMEAWVQYELDQSKDQLLHWQSYVPYNLITAEGFDRLMRTNKQVHVLDIRSKEDFANQSKDNWRNVGRIKDAQNVPYGDLQKQVSTLPAAKNIPIVVYSFSSNNEIFEAARILTDHGYQNVNVLLGGLFSLRWKAANLKGRSQLKDWAVNVPAENQ